MIDLAKHIEVNTGLLLVIACLLAHISYQLHEHFKK